MARVFNLLIVIFEIIALFKVKKTDLKKSLIYYTRISNLLAFFSSLLLVILGPKGFVEVFRFLSVSMLAMTFFVTVFILVPMSRNVKGLLFSGSGFFHHLLVPILSVLSYMTVEDRASLIWIWLPAAVTLIYGLTMLYLNAKEKVDGPYPFFRIKAQGVKKTVLWMVALMMAVSIMAYGLGYRKAAQTDIKYIFVHGLSGWGSYDFVNEFIPYWGLTGGSITRYLNDQGYESYAASVNPTGSAWDRACELYAQLSGSRVDYGEAHSRAAGHERYGEDFSGRALMEDFASSRFALIGHSFGGATVRLFSEILRNGDAAERAATEESGLSPFFKGGNGDKLVALVTLAAPTNGTTAYDLYEDESFDLSSVKIPAEYEKNSGAVSKATKAVQDGRAAYDYAAFDMHIDNALALNERISTFEDVLYLAYPASSTMKKEDGSVYPDPSITENMFLKGAVYMSSYTGATKGGFELDASWQDNDGLVNTISAGAPFNAPQVRYEDDPVLKPGHWTVMPLFKGDHMSVIGGFTKRTKMKPFYLEMVKMIAEAAQ
ncbi:MAG: hypothetical protein K5697_01620 [Lachnospiraceae bacterium]|nr:hypothetical protein [Lachnospiraceae bacterium]